MSTIGVVVIRSATAADLPAVVRLLADDPLGATRERPDARRFYERLGFEATHIGMKLKRHPRVKAGGSTGWRTATWWSTRSRRSRRTR